MPVRLRTFERYLSVRQRLLFTSAVTIVVGVYAYWFFPYRPVASDIAQLWHAARAFLSGANPYDAVGPGRTFEWPYPLFYPLPAVLVIAPFSLVPLRIAETLFVAVGCGWLAWKLEPHQRWIFLTAALWATAQTAQWGSLLTAAALTPAFGFLLIAKPSIGLPLFLAYPSWKSAVGCAVLLLVSLALWPGWVVEWLSIVHASGQHVTAPMWDWQVGGFLLPLALMKWRRPEARLLLGLACIPHTPGIYDVVPLCLVLSCIEEGLIFVVLTYLVRVAYIDFAPVDDLAAGFALQSKLITALVYLPCLAMVMRRPNVGVLPSWRWTTPSAKTSHERPLTSAGKPRERLSTHQAHI